MPNDYYNPPAMPRIAPPRLIGPPAREGGGGGNSGITPPRLIGPPATQDGSSSWWGSNDGAGYNSPAGEMAEDPSAIYDFAHPGQFTVPGVRPALNNLRDLQMQSVGGLSDLMDEDTSAQRRAIQRAMYNSQAEGINQTADDLGRNINEGTFSRGVGLSTITGDLQQRLMQERLDALARAGREAFIGAGGEQRADLASQLAMLGQGFNQGTTGLQGEANIGFHQQASDEAARQFALQSSMQEMLARLNREQQTNLQRGAFGQQNLLQRGQFNQQTALQNALLAQQRLMQERGFENARDLQSDQMLAGGISAGLGGLGSIFGPSVRDTFSPMFTKWLQGLFGVTPPRNNDAFDTTIPDLRIGW